MSDLKINECMDGVSGIEEIIIATISIIPAIAVGFFAFNYLKNRDESKEQPKSKITDCSLEENNSLTNTTFFK